MKIKKFLLFAFLSVVFGLFQFSNFSILGTKPDFALIFIGLVSVFISDFWEGVFFIALLSLVLKFSPYASVEILEIFVSGVIVLIGKKYLPFHRYLGFFIVIVLLTIAFYAILYPLFIWSFIFLKEILYNIIIGSIIFLFISKFKLIYRR